MGAPSPSWANVIVDGLPKGSLVNGASGGSYLIRPGQQYSVSGSGFSPLTSYTCIAMGIQGLLHELPPTQAQPLHISSSAIITPTLSAPIKQEIGSWEISYPGTPNSYTRQVLPQISPDPGQYHIVALGTVIQNASPPVLPPVDYLPSFLVADALGTVMIIGQDANKFQDFATPLVIPSDATIIAQFSSDSSSTFDIYFTIIYFIQ